MNEPSAFEAAADRAWEDAVYEAARPLVGFDIELHSRGVHTVNPVRGRLLRVGSRAEPTRPIVAAFFGVGHLVIEEEDYSSLNVHPRNVTSIRALPTARNAVAVIDAAAA